MTTSKKIYLTVLIVALGVLVTDKVLLRPSITQPQTSRAAAPSHALLSDRVTLDPPGIDPMSIPPSPVTPHTLWSDLWQRMEKVLPLPHPNTAGLPIRNLFIPSEEMKDLLTPKTAEKQKPKLEEQITHLKLSGIVITPQRCYALINDQVVLLGELIGPYRLIKITPNEVILQDGEDRITLSFVR